MRLSKTKAAIASMLAIAALSASAAQDKLLYEFFQTDRAPVGSEVELGVWNSNIDACIELSKKTGIPMIGVWSREGCAHCQIFEHAITSDLFREWVKKSGLILGFSTSLDDGNSHSDYPGIVFGEGGVRQGTATVAAGTPTGYTGSGRYWKWCKGPENLSNYPEVRFIWYEDGKKKVDYAVLGDTVDGQQGIAGGSYNKAGQKVIDYITNKTGFKDYLDNPKTLSSYSGGKFEDSYTDGNRLEVEDGTGVVSIPMVRDENAAVFATNNILKVVGPNGETVETTTVEWSAGQSGKTVSVDMSKVNFENAKDGDKVLVIAVDDDGVEQATNVVTYVVGSGKSPANPLWIGERKAVSSKSDIPVLEYGEWTMDLDVAKNKVASEDGEAYTLVAVVGSLWCHDCANTERNFIGVTNGQGENRFSAWAAANKVALVSIDIPRFSTNSIECASPTLLSRKAHSTALAIENSEKGQYDVSKGGAPESLAKEMERSGLGYLTRKGVSDEESRTVLERNRGLVTTLYSEGGLRSTADTNQYRTGVPIFVVLDKKGNVKARLTRFASKSPYLEDVAKWDDIIKRFDEMLAIARSDSEHDDGGVLENDAPSADIKGFRASGGSASGEICHADFQDVFKLEGVNGNVLQKVAVTGACDSVVAVQFLKLDASGKSQAFGSAVSGVLSGGITLEETFTESGNYFVKVSGGDVASGDFAVDSAKAGNFAAFSISGSAVLVPQETRASGAAPQDSDKVVMRLEEGEMYRIEGVAPASVAGILAPNTPDDPYCKFYTALASGDFELTSAYGNGGTVTYQKWVASQIGFVSQSETVKESVGSVSVGLVRTGGVSGEVVVRVSLDEEATTLYDGDKNARFEFDDVEITWKDGESHGTNVVIIVNDDTRFDGAGDVALKLVPVSDENGDTVMTATNFVLTVKEDDKQSAGLVAFTGVEPFFSKKDTVYAKASDGATLYAERLEASDGHVSAQVKVSGDATVEVGGKATNVVVWANHKYEKQAVRIAGIPAGKSATAILEKPTDGLKVVTASSKVKVVSVADDAPEFESDSDSDSLYRYVSYSKSYPVKLAAGADGATLSFKKLSGTLPAGLSASWDAEKKALSISGTPTAKAGEYTMVYQAVQKVGTTTTPGLTIEIAYTVSDPTAADESAAFNEAVAASGTRTFKGIAMIALNKELDEAETNRLGGLLTVTVPKSGKASAKLVCAAGTIPFMTKGWGGFNDKGDMALTAELSSTKTGYAMDLVVDNDGGMTAVVTTPNGVRLEGSSKGNVWSKSNPAEEWKGCYTVQLLNAAAAESLAGVAPRGNGYLALRMDTPSAVNSGTVKWAGMLPNGTAISGSAILNADDECAARIPIYARSSSDEVACLLEVPDCDTISGDTETGAFWRHAEKYDETTWQVEFNAYGAQYSSSENLAEACQIGYGTTTPTLSFDIDGLGVIAAGTPSAVESVTVDVGEKTLTLDKNNAAGASISINRSTGVVTGSFVIPYTDANGASKSLKANFKGVVLLGWGEDCGCGDDDPNRPVALPFVNGAFYISDKVDAGGKKQAVKRGGAIYIGK